MSVFSGVVITSDTSVGLVLINPCVDGMFSVVSICSVGEVFQILISVTEPEPVSSVGFVLNVP